jgi:hypothetical protein
MMAIKISVNVIPARRCIREWERTAHGVCLLLWVRVMAGWGRIGDWERTAHGVCLLLSVRVMAGRWRACDWGVIIISP